ncbi:MAG TPA: CaiB/BaiF CoA-transferase family protein [Trebonia sp.]|jgi:crotonobetainyl-CoA:carnitine CoA-transferase CaiB-like acyl-CoA transferase|nr:CaiB/BaiF CoA-transferase family protein [Trebonia sp.]
MKPLQGIRVIDVTMWAFCPSAAAILASWGADVVHVENPASPDPMRVFAGGSVEPGHAHWLFKHYNRGKRSVAINLATAEGQEVLHTLVAGADVFVTSFLERTRKKLRFDVDDLRAVNPRLVYAKGSGAGPLGPEAHRGGYDGATWWNRGSLASTAMSVTGGQWPPGMIGHGDGMSGLVFAGGIAAALLGRERTGEPAVVDSSLLGTAMWFNAPAITSSKFPAGQRLFQSQPSRSDLHWASSTYQTADGRFVMLSMLGDHQDEWLDFCEHIGRTDLAGDHRFATAAGRAASSAALVAILDEVFAARTYAEWGQILVTLRGVWAPVQSAAQMHDDPQAVANGMVTDVDYAGGTLSLVSPPVMFDAQPDRATRAPELGEHTDEVLAAAGYPAEAITKMRESGVVG